MSLLCLELCTPGEVSIGTDWLTLVVGVTCGNTARMGVGVGVLCSVFPLGVDMGGLVLGNLEALKMGLVLGLAFKAVSAGKGNLSLGGGRPPGDAMAACCLVNLVGVHGGIWFASLGGGRPRVGLAAYFLVNLVGEHSGSWFAAAICAIFCFLGRVPGTIGRTC
jgi:hypothetical protein